MNRAEVINKLFKVLSTMTKEEISEDSILIDDLGLKSMDLLVLSADLEEVFKTRLDEGDVVECETVSELTEYVCSCL